MSYRFSATPASDLEDINRLTLRLTWRQRVANKRRGPVLPNFQTYCKATVVRTAWCWQRKRGEWSRMEGPERDPQK